MARELRNIMASGELPALTLGTLQVRQTVERLDAYVDELQTTGVPLPELPAADAAENRVFFNTDNNRVCWKAPGGLVFRFRMQLV